MSLSDPRKEARTVVMKGFEKESLLVGLKDLLKECLSDPKKEARTVAVKGFEKEL